MDSERFRTSASDRSWLRSHSCRSFRCSRTMNAIEFAWAARGYTFKRHQGVWGALACSYGHSAQRSAGRPPPTSPANASLSRNN